MFNKKTIIAGDFNAHHALWSCKRNERGKLVYDASFEHNYCCLNSGGPTRIQLVDGSLQQSSPDITFVSVDIADKCKWTVSNESLGSDHIILSVTMEYHSEIPIVHKRNFKEARWDKYTEELDNIFSETMFASNIDLDYNSFKNAVYLVADKTIPWIKSCQDPSSKFKPKPYWNCNLSKAVAERRLALSHVRRNPTPDNYILYKSKLSLAHANKHS